MTRLLYILPGLVPPGEDASRDKFSYISEITEGEILLPVWWDSPEKAPPYLKSTFPVYRVGNFQYHMFLAFRPRKFLRRMATFFFYIRRGWQLHRERKFDVIVAYGTNRPGVAAVILKWLTGAKMIVEVPGVPEDAFRYDAADPGMASSLKRYFADRLLNFVGGNADRIKLLYPTQLRKYPKLTCKKVAVFHDFVPVNTIQTEPSDERFVLSVGYPWYTKGMDILIRAFKRIAPQFPEYKLKLLGFVPDRRYLDELAAGCPQIEFLPGSPLDKTLKVIAACSVYVLASRTDSMGRVLLEAMAAQKPIVAAAVGGVPYYVADNSNGLLFEPENVDDLASQLTLVLRNGVLRAHLARAGFERVTSELDERAYVSHFAAMIRSLANDCDQSRSVADDGPDLFHSANTGKSSGASSRVEQNLTVCKARE
jgi:glycosyltransferase involved in cell wall biosynthesis